MNLLDPDAIFNCMGNHDNNPKIAGDWAASTDYREQWGPTYYSFNIGDVHYVVLDDILCKNTGTGGDGRKYESTLTTDQLSWLKKDLSFVSTSTPLVITMHAPLYNDSEDGSLNNTSEFEEIVKSYTCLLYTSDAADEL